MQHLLHKNDMHTQKNKQVSTYFCVTTPRFVAYTSGLLLLWSCWCWFCSVCGFGFISATAFSVQVTIESESQLVVLSPSSSKQALLWSGIFYFIFFLFNIKIRLLWNLNKYEKLITKKIFI